LLTRDLAAVATEARKGCAGLRKIHSALEGLNEEDSGVPLPEVNDHDPALILYNVRHDRPVQKA